MFPSALSMIIICSTIVLVLFWNPIQRLADRYSSFIHVLMIAAGLIVLREAGLLGVIVL